MGDRARGGGDALPTDAELKLLRELWRGGELTVAEVHARLSRVWPVGYTTVLKLMQRLHEKGLVRRNREGRAHRYAPAVREGPTERRIVRDFLRRAFGGSAGRLIRNALPELDAGSGELEEIRRLLDEMEERE